MATGSGTTIRGIHIIRVESILSQNGESLETVLILVYGGVDKYLLVTNDL